MVVSVVGMMISCGVFIPVRVGVRIVNKPDWTGIVFLNFSIGVEEKRSCAPQKLEWQEPLRTENYIRIIVCAGALSHV